MDRFQNIAHSIVDTAEKGRTSVVKQMNKVDDKYAQRKHSTGSADSSRPGLAPTHSVYSSGHSEMPPPPPVRAGGAAPLTPSTPPAVPSVSRPGVPTATRPVPSASPASVPRTSPAPGAGAGLFSGLDATEKQAFFALLDEYFASRPELAAGLASRSSAAPAYAPASASASPVPAPVAAPVPAQPAGIATARALYTFTSAEPGDLNFNEGDIITITEYVDESWAKGTIGGRQGIFPRNYVQ